RHTRFSRDWSSDVCSSDLRMRQTYEQHLEAVKEAYALLNESSGMDDTGDLPRTGQTGTFEETAQEQQRNTHDGKNSEHIDQALAVFGLGKNFPQQQLAAACQQHITDLKTQLAAAALPAIKAAYEKELAKAEHAWETIAGWLV